MDRLLPEKLVTLAAEVVRQNSALGRRVATAESCTGGLVSAALTEISGSSAVFLAGFATYSNEAKIAALNVPPGIIAEKGAVSVDTALAMAKGALENSQADVAISITGVAGPGGGSAEKPVGTVIFARAKRKGEEIFTESWRKAFDRGGCRGDIRHDAALYGLELLLP